MKTNTIIIVALCLLSQTLWGQLLSMKPYDNTLTTANQALYADLQQTNYSDRQKFESKWGLSFDKFEKPTDLRQDFLRVKSATQNTSTHFETVQQSPIAGKVDRHNILDYKTRLIEWQKSMTNRIIWEE